MTIPHESLIQSATKNAHQVPFCLPKLSAWKQKKMLAWANQVLTAQYHLQNIDGISVVQKTLENTERHLSMQHYPKGDRIDFQLGGQYFYHCHRENHLTTEHGHFHCFLRQTGIPKHIRRTPKLNWKPQNSMTHLVAIGMNQQGQPIRLFTVNRWVTDETWYAAQQTRHLIKRFKLNLQDKSPWQTIDRWVEGMVHLFSPHILWLHQQRDVVMQCSSPECYEDRNIEELSSLDIQLSDYIQWIINAGTGP